MTDPRKLRVFLCHSSQDKPIVRELYQRLLAEGWIDPWLDEEKILPGQNWDLEINKAVEKSEVVIVFLSKKSVSKEGYVQKEIKKILDIADEKPEETLFVIPLRLDDCQIPSRLAKWQYEDYFPDDQRKNALKRISLSLSARYSQLNIEDNYSQSSNVSPVIEWDEKWIEKHRSVAHAGLIKNNFGGFVELRFSLINQKTKITQKQLLIAAQKAQIHTFGWPIGIVSDTPQSSPKPQADGIKAEIEFRMDKPNGPIRSYDYWALRINGDMYLLKSLFEDSDESRFKKGSVILFDTRIHRATEILLYCQRLYNELGVNPSEIVNIEVKYGGLTGRRLSSVKGRILPRINNVCTEDEIESAFQTKLADISTNLVGLVKEIVSPLFLLFGFQEFADSIYEDIVVNYAHGKIV